MESKADRKKLLLLMGIMAVAAVIAVWWEGSEARAYQYADVDIYEAENGTQYLFLPSWADREAEEYRYEQRGVTVMQSENLASLEITTQSGSLERLRSGKEETEGGKLKITLADGTECYEGVIEEMKGRGNSTWALDKKPFQIKLQEKADLFGMGEAKTWILLANGFDETGIRNTIAFWMAKEAGLAFTPESVAVDLYCNGEYQGNYLLCEKVQAGEERVDIGNGFLIERELQDRYEIAVYLEGKGGFVTKRGDYFLIEHPENPTQEQIEAIRSFVQEAEDAVFAQDGVNPDTGRAWSEYLDKDSFVRKYLLEEVTKNYDGGVTSAYYYMPEGEEKLYAGPAWDYDVIFGNNTLDEMSSNPKGITELSDHIFGSDLYSALMDQEDFREAVFDCFETVFAPMAYELLENGIDELSARTRASVAMDHVRWQEMDNRYQYYESYEDNLRYLRYFLEERTEFLEEVWMGGEVYRTVTLQVEGSDWRKFYVKDGGILGELPVPFLNNHLFIGWYRSDGKKYDPYRPVYEDMIFEAFWQDME